MMAILDTHVELVLLICKVYPPGREVIILQKAQQKALHHAELGGSLALSFSCRASTAGAYLHVLQCKWRHNKLWQQCCVQVGAKKSSSPTAMAALVLTGRVWEQLGCCI